MSKKVILDVDTGMDDAFAIMVAALSPSLDILGITVTHGNQPLEYTLENTLRVTELLGGDIPVYSGCPQAMVRDILPGREHNVRRQITRKVVDGEEITIHKKELPLPKAKETPQKEHACSYIVQTLKNSGEKITVLAVGPLTNIAMSLRMDPSIADNIDEIVIMGGGVNRGNRTPVAEANFYDDPEAAEIVMRSGCRIRIITLDATETVLFGDEEIRAYRDISTAGAFAARLLEDYIRSCELLGIIKDRKIAVHDAVAACAVIDPGVITDLRNQHCNVDCSGGFADGQLIADSRGFLKYSGQIFVAYAVDPEKCRQIVLESLIKGQ